MVLTKTEKNKLRNFNGTIKQAEIIIGKKLTRDEKLDLKLITIVSRIRTAINEDDNLYLNKLFRQKIIPNRGKLTGKEKTIRDRKLKRKLDRYNQNQQRRRDAENDFGLNRLFREPRFEDIAPRLRRLFNDGYQNHYEIVETIHGYPHFDAIRYHYRINGDLDIFHIGKAIEDLFAKMRANTNANSSIRLTISSPLTSKNTRVLRNINLGIEWLHFNTITFLDYEEIELNQIEFILDVYQSQVGSGRALKIIDKDESKSIILIPQTGFTKYGKTICESRSILVALVKCYREYTQENIFKNNLTEADIKAINYKRSIKTKINEGIIQDSEY